MFSGYTGYTGYRVSFTGYRFLGGGSVVVDSLLIVAPIVGFYNCSMFCCALLCVHFSFAIILMGKRERELVALLCLSSWCVALPNDATSAVCDCDIF